MTRRALLILLVSSVALLAERKPITVEDIFAERPSAGIGHAIWAPDGKSFVYNQAGKVRLYDVASRKSRDLFAMQALSSAAVKVPPAERFGWENRGVKEDAIQWAPGGHELLIASGGDIFLWRIASGGF